MGRLPNLAGHLGGSVQSHLLAAIALAAPPCRTVPYNILDMSDAIADGRGEPLALAGFPGPRQTRPSRQPPQEQRKGQLRAPT